MPGVGKTALAVRAARLIGGDYPDGTLYLNLHSGDPGSLSLDPAEALYRLLRMMSVPATQVPDTIADRVALWRAQLSRRRAIVILDDAARPDQVRPLLAASGRCLILITTRRRLAELGGVRTLTLNVLAADDAVTLFRQIAGEDRARDSGQVAEVVRLCGWLPLAIQLTAGRVAQDPRLGLADLIEELSQPPARPGRVGAACPEVMSAFDLSYDALEPDHQRFFRRLGASPCDSVSVQAAAALDGCTLAEAEKALATLLDYHLLTRDGDARFRFHDLIREYAAVRAARDAPEAEQRQAVGRLLDYYLDAADQADRVLHPFRHRRPVAVSQPPVAIPPVATRGRRGQLAGIGVAQHPAGRAVRRPARVEAVEAEVRRPDPRAGRLHGDPHVLGRGDRRPHPGPAGRPRPGRPGQDRAGVAGPRRGPAADRAPRGGASAGRGSRGDLPVAGRPERAGRRARPAGPGAPAHGPVA